MSKSPASRRKFLKTASNLSLVGAATPFALNLAALSAASAQTAGDYKALVCIFMLGGNDHGNTVLATDSESWSIYNNLRGGGDAAIALPEASAAGGVLPITPATTQSGRSFALHPELGSLQAMFNNGTAAIASNIGPLVAPVTRAQYLNESVPVPPKLFSHNDQQSVWQAFGPEGALFGWGGRIGDLVASMNAEQSFTCISPAGNAVWIAGDQTVPYQISVAGPTSIYGVRGGPSAWPSGVASIFEDLITQTGGNVFEQSIATTTRASIDAQQKLEAALVADASLAAPPTVPLTGRPNWLATQLRIVARIIGARATLGMRRQVFLVTLGGFDTHDNQVARHTPLVQELSQAIQYFNDLMANPAVNASNDVTVATASEFGRTMVTNGDGTDHGWGSHHFVVGGAVSGGDIYGQFPSYTRDGVDDVGNGRLLPKYAVDQYGATLARWMGVDDALLNDVFPNLQNFGSARDLGFMG
jgi:uncharacterized protein (DUF1501 family)